MLEILFSSLHERKIVSITKFIKLKFRNEFPIVGENIFIMTGFLANTVLTTVIICFIIIPRKYSFFDLALDTY